MKRNVLSVLTVSLMCMILSGCATIVSGTTQKVAVTSNPSGAKVTADGKMTAVTPTDFVLDRKSDHSLEFSKEGYKSTTVLLKRTINGMLAGNILIGGIIGTGVDAVSGANNKLIPERVNVALESGEGTSEVPHFTTPADEEFYQKNILKPAQDKAKKEEKAAAKAKTASAPTTNFAAKSAAPATQVQ